MKSHTHPIAVKALLSLALALGTVSFAAESLSALLQKGIFAEETEGNLDAAIKIYEGIVKEAEANRSLAAQAQYRLAVCYQKKGNKEQAIAALRQLIAAFPNEGTLNEKARALLRDLGYVPKENIIIRKLPVQGGWGVSISPDGKWVSYQNDNWDIVLFDTASEERRTVVKAAGWNSRAARYTPFSPDGRQIAYVLWPFTNIYVKSIGGPDPKPIYRAESGWVVAPGDWSTDGRSLVLGMAHLTDGMIRIGILSLDGQAFREVATVHSPDFADYVRLSPGGDLLAYRVESSREEKAGVYVVQILTGSQTKVSGGKNDKLVGWAPGTDKVVFLSDRTGVAGLWSVGFAGGKPAGDPELIRANVGDISPIGIATNGAIYYREQVSLTDVYLATADFETGKVLSPPKRATDRFPGKNTWPIWSHDGQKLGFIRLPPDGSVRGASFSVLTLSTGEQRDFSLAGSFTSAIRQTDWSHDESFLLLQSTDVNGRRGIHKLILESGKSEPLLTRNPAGTPDNDWNNNPRISPDGKSLYYDRRKFSYEGDKESWSDYIFRRHLGTGQEELVYHSPESLNIWASPTEISPDGKELATMIAEQDVKRPTKPEAIKILPLGGGEVRTLVTVPPPVHLCWARWTPDGKRIVFLKQEKEKVKEVWSIPSAGGNATRIELQLPDLFGFSLHPDGRQIALQATTEGKPEVWVMENVLRGRAAAAK